MAGGVRFLGYGIFLASAILEATVHFDFRVLSGPCRLLLRYAILCYRAPGSGVKGTNSPIKVVLSGMAIMLLVSVETYLFLSSDALRDQWIEIRVFGFARAFFATLARVIVGVLCWGAALFLGAKLLRNAIQNSRRQA
jgi:hypothetical protein